MVVLRIQDPKQRYPRRSRRSWRNRSRSRSSSDSPPSQVEGGRVAGRLVVVRDVVPHRHHEQHAGVLHGLIEGVIKIAAAAEARFAMDAPLASAYSMASMIGGGTLAVLTAQIAFVEDEERPVGALL